MVPTVDVQAWSVAVAGAKKGSVLSAGWFIGMMVAIAILLLILIIVCIVKRNRGKEYKCKCSVIYLFISFTNFGIGLKTTLQKVMGRWGAAHMGFLEHVPTILK